MFRLHCGWDIGQSHLIFTTKEVAFGWAVENWPRDVHWTLSDAVDEGLIIVEKLEIISE